MHDMTLETMGCRSGNSAPVLTGKFVILQLVATFQDVHDCHKYSTNIQQHDGTRSFDLLVLELDRLAIHKDTLALVWLWDPPRPNLGGELHDHLSFWAFQQ
jgi:hypothetical protein